MQDLTPTLYAEVRRIAAELLRRDGARHSISARDLAHEALLRAQRFDAAAGLSRAELLPRIAKLCRQVLVDHGRRRRRVKRGQGSKPVQLVGSDVSRASLATLDVVALGEALDELEQLDERQAAVVDMKFFGGFTTPEIATATGVATRTVESDWTKARAWLNRALSGERDAGS